MDVLSTRISLIRRPVPDDALVLKKDTLSGVEGVCVTRVIFLRKGNRLRPVGVPYPGSCRNDDDGVWKLVYADHRLSFLFLMEGNFGLPYLNFDIPDMVFYRIPTLPPSLVHVTNFPRSFTHRCWEKCKRSSYSIRFSRATA